MTPQLECSVLQISFISYLETDVDWNGLWPNNVTAAVPDRLSSLELSYVILMPYQRPLLVEIKISNFFNL